MFQEEALLVYTFAAGKDREGTTYGMTHHITVSQTVTLHLLWVFTARHSLSGVSWVLDCEYTPANMSNIRLLIKQFINSFVSCYVTWRCPLQLKSIPGDLPEGNI